MSQINSLPYLTPRMDRIEVSDWYRLDGDESIPLGELLEDWDAAVDIHMKVAARIDLDGIYEDCQLSPDAQLRFAASWHSAGTGLRGKASAVDLNKSHHSVPLDIKVKVRGTDIAKTLNVALCLVLVSPGTPRSGLTPRLAGSILWQRNKHVLLEGESARFPVELVDFAAKSWAVPSNAGWFLQWDPDDLSQTILGDIRLYLNANHAVVSKAINGKEPEDHIVREMIFFDVARSLVVGALANDDFVQDASQYPNGTVGAAVRDILENRFQGRSFSSLRSQMQTRNLFEARLQEHLHFLREIIP